jgi:hypothetical protein
MRALSLPMFLVALLGACPALRAEMRILFCARESTSAPYDLYSMRPDGTDLLQHTTTATISEWAPVLSPDGTRIAFVDPTLSTNNLRVMALTGGPAVTVPISGKANSVQWIDDHSLAYLRQGGSNTQYQIYRVNENGTEAAIYATVWRSPFTGVDSFQYHRASGRLYFGASTNPPSSVPCTPQSGLLAAAGPDIVFTRGTDALVAGETGSQGTTLVDHYDSAASPDGTKIAYCADHGTGYHKLYVRNNSATDTASQLRVCDQYCGDPEWSPDGTWLAFTRATASTFGSSAYAGNIHRVNANGTALTNLTVGFTTIAGRAAHPMMYESAPSTLIFAIQISGRPSDGTLTLSWPVKPGFLYRLKSTDDILLPWQTDLPNSVITAGPFQTVISYNDSRPAVPRRFYQVSQE